MSWHTWTPTALKSNLRPARGSYWRAVEAQHKVSTLKLVDSSAEQEALEALLEESKPPLKPGTERLSYLYAAPFRYIAHATPARFRGPVAHGLLYAAQVPETCVYEKTWQLLGFYESSPETAPPLNASELTVFDVCVSAQQSLDLHDPVFVQNLPALLHASDYGPSASFAIEAEAAGAQLITYPSVRDPKWRPNIAVFDPECLTQVSPKRYQTWKVRLSRQEAVLLCDATNVRIVLSIPDWRAGMA